MRAALLILLLLTSCAPIIPRDLRVPPDAFVESGPRLAPCVVLNKRRRQALFAAVSGVALGSWDQVLATVLVPHPKGLLAIDPGIGSTLHSDLEKTPWWFGPVVEDGTATPLLDRFTELGLSPKAVRWAAVTHGHWDHTGALRDLPAAEVWMSRTELDWVKAIDGDYGHGALPHMVRAVEERVKPFDFDGPPALGFPASKDLFGDGSVLAVPMPGHTPGSTGYFIRGVHRSWLLIGDTAWSYEGVKRPAHKPPPVRALLEHDPVALSESLGRLHALHRERPDIAVVPSHDGASMRTMPLCTSAGLAR